MTEASTHAVDPAPAKGFGRDDLRAAVAAGMITEAQAASVLALADSRRGIRENLDGMDEPFELFRGFNEIFIVVGLVILYSGWLGVTGLMTLGNVMIDGQFAVYAAIAMAIIALLARYFTIRRRMIAPSIALAIMFATSCLHLGISGGWAMGLDFQTRMTVTFGLTTAALVIYYLVFRVPFVMAMIAIGVFLTCGAAFVLGGAGIPTATDLFRLSADGPFAWITILLGVIGLAVAMVFDMSDPHRVTRRAASAFWLHVIAAPAIVNTVAQSLLATGTAAGQGILLAFLGVMALFAVAIDRRSFLVAGVGYVVALAVLVLQDGAMLAILLLGLGLVLLGAKWERLRGGLMNALPAFPGKQRLPPWSVRPSAP